MNSNYIYKNLKENYNEVQKVLDKNPLRYNFISKLAIIFCVILVIWTMIFTFAKQLVMKYIVLFYVIGFILDLGTISIMIIYILYVKNNPIIKKRKEDSTILHRMLLEDEAKKCQVSVSVLALYLYYMYKPSKVYKILQYLIIIVSCILSIKYLPSWSSNNGKVLFVVTLLCNIIVNIMFGSIQKKIDDIYMDELKKYAIEPFEDEFKKINDMKL